MKIVLGSPSIFEGKFLSLDHIQNNQPIYIYIYTHNITCIGQRDICSCLIQEGGKLDIRNEEGNTALHLAAIEEQDEIAILLLNNGANIRLCNKSDQKPVFYAKPKLQNTIISMINEGLIE